ncbi:MAG: GTP 3',8-cyclase MoaA [Rhodospirillales bacterium]|nr:GTP 3',8-cyclase MoaA [Alphaproteobacteria bacterium]MCB9986812.1 GTP 3',8-cyclase MoaA [Rhodospirillales bacterium]USO08423.1 MAG: GTP 3',8-cyclase MoaA [Rhodospirillales bacterium]
MEQAHPLQDAFGRRFSYLRLSLTDICNFKCSYCLPNGYQKCGDAAPMTRDEILRLVRAFAGLGIWKVRITGGEPTLRPDFIEIAESISRIEGIRKLALTTNGYKLPERALGYRLAGINAINLSIDSLDNKRFAQITGHDRLAEVMHGLDVCEHAGFSSIKINAVLLKGLNDKELSGFLELVKHRPVSVRFIELMRTNDNADYFKEHHLSAALIAENLEGLGWKRKDRELGAGPAQEFWHPEHAGCIGLIAPYSKDFCKSCNRLRVSSRAEMHLCLFGEGGYPLRDLLQHDDQRQELQEKIMSLLGYKREAHALHQGCSGATQHLASIGG